MLWLLRSPEAIVRFGPFLSNYYWPCLIRAGCYLLVGCNISQHYEARREFIPGSSSGDPGGYTASERILWILCIQICIWKCAESHHTTTMITIYPSLIPCSFTILLLVWSFWGRVGGYCLKDRVETSLKHLNGGEYNLYSLTFEHKSGEFN